MICLLMMFVHSFLVAFGFEGFIKDMEAMCVACLIEFLTIDIAAVMLLKKKKD